MRVNVGQEIRKCQVKSPEFHWGHIYVDVTPMDPDAHPYKEAPYELYTRDSHWRPEVKRLLNDYFPKRSSAFIEQLKAAQLYPAELD